MSSTTTEISLENTRFSIKPGAVIEAGWSRWKKAGGRPYAIAWLVGVLSSLFYFLVRQSYADGDALIYADNILRARFGDISVHTGYYLVGFGFYKVTGMSVDTALIVMSALAGGIALAYTYLFSEHFLDDRRKALLTTIILAVSGSFLAYATTAEVYMPQAAAVIASLYYFIRGRAYISGLLFAVATLITPLSSVVAVAFIYLAWDRPQRVRFLLKFAAAFAIVYIPVFLPVYHELLWGRRGLLMIAGKSPRIPIGTGIVNFAYVLVKSFLLMAPFVVVGYLVFFFRNRRIFWFITVVLAANAYYVVKARETSSLESWMVPIMFLFALMAAEGLIQVFGGWMKRGWLSTGSIILAVVTFAAISLYSSIGMGRLIHPSIFTDTSYQKAMETTAAYTGDDGLVIASFWHGVSYAFYSRTDPNEELETTRGNTRWIDEQYLRIDDLNGVLSQGLPVCVVESYSPSPGARLFLSDDELAQRHEAYSLKERLERELKGLRLRAFINTHDLTIYRAVKDSSAVQR